MVYEHAIHVTAREHPATAVTGAGSAPDALVLLERGNASYTALRDRFAEQAGLYPADFAAVLVVDECPGPVRSGELASWLGLSSGAVTYLADRLSTSGHLQRERHPQDRRKVLLSCTPKGHAEAEAFRTVVSGAVTRATQGLDPGSVDQADRVLERLADTLPAAFVGRQR